MTLGLKLWEWITGSSSAEADPVTQTVEITIREMFSAAQEYKIHNLCLNVCLNMIANAISRCEVRTYRNHKEVWGSEHYLWNIEPNVNQNSTMFLHEMAYRLCKDNEVLIIAPRRKNGGESLLVAEDWAKPVRFPQKMNEYKGVRVGQVTYDKTFRENDVLHLKLNHVNILPAVQTMTASFERLHAAAVKLYEWSNGQHWKVHVNQLQQGDPEFVEKFQKMIDDQVKPFLSSNGAVLPEFDGYDFTNVGAGTGPKDSRDIRALVEDVFDMYARGFGIPAVLVNGKVEATGNADHRWLSGCIQPICDQWQEEANRKRYGYDQWVQGNYLRVDASNINHFDLFANAGNVEKLIGSGVFTVNGILRAAGQPTIPEDWADEHYMTKNIARMSEAVQPMRQEGGTKQ